MNQDTKELAKTWINCCMSIDSKHELDQERFNDFLISLFVENTPLEVSDIEGLVAECGKNWNDEEITTFAEWWYNRYEIIKSYESRRNLRRL